MVIWIGNLLGGCKQLPVFLRNRNSTCQVGIYRARQQVIEQDFPIYGFVYKAHPLMHIKNVPVDGAR